MLLGDFVPCGATSTLCLVFMAVLPSRLSGERLVPQAVKSRRAVS